MWGTLGFRACRQILRLAMKRGGQIVRIIRRKVHVRAGGKRLSINKWCRSFLGAAGMLGNPAQNVLPEEDKKLAGGGWRKKAAARGRGDLSLGATGRKMGSLWTKAEPFGARSTRWTFAVARPWRGRPSERIARVPVT